MNPHNSRNAEIMRQNRERRDANKAAGLRATGQPYGSNQDTRMLQNTRQNIPGNYRSIGTARNPHAPRPGMPPPQPPPQQPVGDPRMGGIPPNRPPPPQAPPPERTGDPGGSSYPQDPRSPFAAGGSMDATRPPRGNPPPINFPGRGGRMPRMRDKWDRRERDEMQNGSGGNYDFEQLLETLMRLYG